MSDITTGKEMPFAPLRITGLLLLFFTSFSFVL